MMEQNFKDYESLLSSSADIEGYGYSQVHPNYAIFNPICTDVTGTLYRGKSVLDDRILAVKLFTGEVTPALVSVDDKLPILDNLIGVHDVLSGNRGVPLAVMEMPGGACLEKILSKKRKLPVGAAVHIALNIALIIRALHMCNVTHGHINAQSVFLKTQANGKIGVQLLHHGLVGRPARFNQHRNLSPELICDNDSLMPSDDNWAIAVLLHEMIFGVSPFSGDIRDDIARRVLTEELVLPPAFEREHANIASVLRKSLRKDLASRPSGREMNLLLKSILSSLRPDSDTSAQLDASGGDAAQPSDIEALSSVPAESFQDEELRDTRPEPIVLLSDVVSSVILPEYAIESSSQYGPLTSKDEHETVAGGHTEANLDETPVLGYLPIQADEIMEVDVDGLFTSPLPQDPLRIDINAITPPRFDDVTVMYPSLQSVHPVGRSLSDARPVRRVRYSMALLAGALILTAVLTALYFLIWRISDGTDDPVAASAKINESRTRAVAPNLSNAAASVEPAISRENVAEAPVETITITLKGLPSGAYVTLNGIEVELPLEVPRSDTPVAVQAIVGNRIVFAETLVPLQSQTFYVSGSLKKSHISKQQKKRDDGTKEPAASKRDASGKLRMHFR